MAKSNNKKLNKKRIVIFILLLILIILEKILRENYDNGVNGVTLLGSELNIGWGTLIIHGKEGRTKGLLDRIFNI